VLIKSINLLSGDVSKMPKYLSPEAPENSELVFHLGKHKPTWVKFGAVGWKKTQLNAVKP